MLGSRPMSEWITQYGHRPQHPVNRWCHTIGIPLIAVSIPLFVVAVFAHRVWPVPVVLFVVGWAFQFIGHAFEGKPPESLRESRSLFVALRWWYASLRGPL